MKYLIFFLFSIFTVTITFSQVKNDSIKTDLIKEIRYSLIQKWENQIDNARERGDLYTEMILLEKVIRHRITDLGDNTGAYELAIYLEELVHNSPKEKAVKQIEANLNMLLGMLLRDQFRFNESLKYFKIATKLSVRDSLFSTYRDASNHVGEMLSRLKHNEEALNVFIENESKGLPFKGDSIEYLTRVYQFKAEHFFRNNELDSMLYYAKRSVIDGAVPSQQSNRFALISTALLRMNADVDSIMFYAKKSLKIAQNIGAEREEIYSHNLLRQAYLKEENYEKAYYHFDEFFKLRQKQRSYNNALKIGNFNTQQEKEKAIIQEALSDEKLSNQRLVIWLVSGGLLILILGVIFILNRLKLIRKQSEIIEQEKLRAEQSERYKEQFLANMSHEIRTPMHAISGMVNSLKRQKHPASQSVFLDAMKISADNLLVILNDVLDMSKIESGSLDIERVKMNPSEIINQVIIIFQYKAEEKGLVLKANIEKDFPEYILGDPGRFNQILMNLVSNAIKFTEKGEIEITLTQQNKNFKIAVKDTGSGISKKQLKSIFESFKQGDNVTKGKHGGTGLGLAISKQLIELQNGRIWVESEENKGSIFFLELPLIVSEDKQGTQSAFTETQLKKSGKQLEGLRILIAEDNAFNIMVVQDDLQWYIPEVNLTFVENGKLAVDKFKQEEFDVVLMDVQMPEMNGYEATKAIRKLETTNKTENSIPIIAMTASLLKNQIDKCYDAGMDGYIPKPYKPEMLINALYQDNKK